MPDCRKINFLLFLLALLVLCPAIVWSGATVGQKMPPLAFNDDSGLATSLDQFAGKVVLLNLWASWCKPCQKELPELNKLAEKLDGNKAAVIVVNLDEDSKAGRGFLKQLEPLYLKPFFDPTQSVPKSLGVEAMPCSYVIDKEGRIAYINLGYKSGDLPKMKKLIEQLLAK